jgi:hypothetical protein
VRQGGGADHETRNQHEEVLLRDAAVLLDLFRRLAADAKGLGVALDRRGAGADPFRSPGLLRRRSIGREVLD